MSIFRFVYLSLRHDFAMCCAVAFGVVVASAVLCGALVIGDTMRGSLRDLTFRRLGPVEEVLTGDSFFREEIVGDVEKQLREAKFQDTLRCIPLILSPAGVTYAEETAGVTLVGCSDAFWNCFTQNDQSDRPESPTRSEPPSQWERNEIVINRALAELLEGGDARPEFPGDDATISLWVSQPEEIPADSALGRKEETVFRARVRIREILPSEGLGCFSLNADQKPQPLALVPLKWLQDRSQLDVPGKINTLVLASHSDGNAHLAASDESENVSKHRDAGSAFGFRPRYSDLGLVLDVSEDGVFHVKSGKMLFTKVQENAIAEKLTGIGFRPAFVYLAESIRASGESSGGSDESLGESDRETPYSLVAALDELHIGAQRIVLKRGEIVLNDWTAEDLGVVPGEMVTITYFDPQSLYGQTKTKSTPLRVSRIVPMRGDAGDSLLVPDMHGISDAESLTNWNPPFPFDAKKIREKDELYWERYRTRPKAFLSLEQAREIWGSRFGECTTFLIDSGKSRDGAAPAEHDKEKRVADNSDNSEKAEIERRLQQIDPAAFGFVFQPVKALGLRASAGTTPFQTLFLAFSFFTIASALMLVVLLFQLALERGASQIGTLLAVGLTRERIGQICVCQVVCVSVLGALLGIPLGVLYAKLMIYGLHHWWVDAIGVPFLTLHVEPSSVLSGCAATVLLSVFAVVGSLRRLRKQSVLRLLRGSPDDGSVVSSKASSEVLAQKRRFFALSGLYVFCGILLTFTGTTTIDPMARSGMFFGFGAFTLLVFLLGIRIGFREWPLRKSAVSSTFAFACSHAARNPKRSMLCVGLLASSSFLVLAVGAFRLHGDDSRGSGGYTFVAETRLPIYFDLNTEQGRGALAMQEADSKRFAQNVRVDAFRVRSGDSAGCLNLYRPNTPRILGVGEGFIRKNRFFAPSASFAEATPLPAEGRRGEAGDNSWEKLLKPISYDRQGIPTVPIILDADTAMYSLHLYRGVGEIYEIDDGRGGTVRCEVAALLSRSLLQGDILMGERNMLELFPEVSGYRFFLLERRESDDSARVDALVRETLGDYGLTMESARERLERLFAVQNTYLATFRSLGGFGILLGTFGIGVVQLRHVIQRRKEWALLQVLGFSRRRILGVILSECVVLLFLGTCLGACAAFLALVPQMFGPAKISVTAALQQFPWVCCGMFGVGVFSNLFACHTANRIAPAQALGNE